MANGQVVKHLTVEVQQLLNQPENKQALMSLGFVSSMKSGWGQNVQLFESGPVLASMEQPQDHHKIEVQVNNDDMSGDQDTIEFSIHSFKDGVEQDEEWQLMLSHFTVSMVRQQGIWRMSKIAVGAEFPVGDPEFLKKTYLKSMTDAGMTGGNASSAAVYSTYDKAEAAQTPELAPGQLVMLIGLAERAFARKHPDIGFTCSLSELSEDASAYSLESRISTDNYKGYKITFSGCQGKPAGSFQVAIEPAPGKGEKAYCTDATGNIRVSDDGRASTCLTSGRVEQTESATGVGVDFHVAEPVAKPKD